MPDYIVALDLLAGDSGGEHQGQGRQEHQAWEDSRKFRWKMVFNAQYYAIKGPNYSLQEEDFINLCLAIILILSLIRAIVKII
jgi:hypothetical protein